eukprot:4463182-Pyramimonas_sp.AAC.1
MPASVRGPGRRRRISSKAASVCTLGGAPRLPVPGLPLPRSVPFYRLVALFLPCPAGGSGLGLALC